MIVQELADELPNEEYNPFAKEFEYSIVVNDATNSLNNINKPVAEFEWDHNNKQLILKVY